MNLKMHVAPFRGEYRPRLSPDLLRLTIRDHDLGSATISHSNVANGTIPRMSVPIPRNVQRGPGNRQRMLVTINNHNMDGEDWCPVYN